MLPAARAGGGAARRSRSARGAEVTVECNPDDVDRRADRRATPTAGVNRVSLGVQSMAAHVLGSLGRTHDRRNVERAVAAVRDAGHADVQPRPDLRRGRRVARRLDAARSSRCSALDPPHVSAYALTIEAGTPLADAARPPSRRRRPGRQVRARSTPLLAGRRPGELRDLELGPSRARVPAQPPVLAPAELPRLRLRRPLAPRTAAAGGTCARRIATSSSSAPATPTEAAGETLDAATRDVRAARADAAHARRRAARRARRRASCPAWSSDSDDRWVLTRRGRLMANAVSLHLK